MIVQCKEEDEDNNSFIQTDMQLTDPASPRTGLGENDLYTPLVTYQNIANEYGYH